MPAAKIEGVRISKNVIKDADDGPVRFGESVICTNHWGKFKAKEPKEKDLLDKLKISKDSRKAKK